MDTWKVQIKGSRSSGWEIAVVKIDNALGQDSWGWFNDNKLLVSHNGGPCKQPICKFVWDEQIKIATELCQRLNNGESILP